MSPDFASLETWVLAGQSNMEGIGSFEDCLPPDERVWNFTTAGNWEVACEPLHKLWESYTESHLKIHRDWLPEDQRGISEEEIRQQMQASRPPAAAAGLGLSFGKTLADELGTSLGLIATAHGGTSLEQWSPAGKTQGAASLYGAMLDRIEKAGAPLKGILWYQGESDCSPDLAPTYLERMAAWVEAVRADLGQPDLPVIVVQLGRLIAYETPEAKWWDAVREALADLPWQVAHTGVAPAIDLDMDDGIHIGSPGLIRLGRRMGRIALRLTGRASYEPGPRVAGFSTSDAHWGQKHLHVHFTGVTGAWQPQLNIWGFSTRTAEGEPHPTCPVIHAERDPGDPQAIRLTVNGNLDDSVHLAYGLGYNPPCNAVDEADMGLLAFRPRRVM